MPVSPPPCGWLCACALSDLLCQQSDVSGDGGMEWRLRESRCSPTFGRNRIYGGGKGHSIGRLGRMERQILLRSLTKARTSSPPPAPGDTAVAPLPGFPKQELQVATILIVVTRVATVMTTASVDVDQPTRDIVVSMSIGSSAGTARAFEGTGIVVEQSSVTASTPNRRNSGHRCAARGRTGPPLEDRSGEPVAGT